MIKAASLIPRQLIVIEVGVGNWKWLPGGASWRHLRCVKNIFLTGGASWRLLHNSVKNIFFQGLQRVVTGQIAHFSSTVFFVNYNVS